MAAAATCEASTNLHSTPIPTLSPRKFGPPQKSMPGVERFCASLGLVQGVPLPGPRLVEGAKSPRRARPSLQAEIGKTIRNGLDSMKHADCRLALAPVAFLFFLFLASLPEPQVCRSFCCIFSGLVH